MFLSVIKILFLTIIVLLTTVKVKGQESASQRQQYQNEKPKLSQSKTKRDWAKNRAQVLRAMQEVMGALPPNANSVPAVIFVDTLEAYNYNRYTVQLQVHFNENLPALLYLPKNKPASTKSPTVLALHATGALGKHLVDSFSKGPYDPVATELANRGYIVLAPDYPSFGDLAQHDFAQDRYESGTMQGIFNHMRCIDYLQSRPDVAPNKIGVIGHSLGGHNAIFLGAFDERVKVVVSSCGWTLFNSYDAGEAATKRFGGKLGPWAQDRYMPHVRDKFNMDAALMPFDFDETIAAIAPRLFFSNSPLQDTNFSVEGVKKGIENAKHIYQLLGVPENLQVYYPTAGHEFPVNIRQKAYDAIDAALK